MTDWNPNSPDTVGLQLTAAAAEGAATKLVAGLTGLGQRFRSVTSNNVTGLRIGTVNPSGGPFVHEVYPNTTFAGSVTDLGDTAAPTGQANVSAGTSGSGGGTTSLWNRVDEAHSPKPAGPGSGGDYIQMVGAGEGIDLWFADLSGTLAGRRITDVRVRGWAYSGNLGSSMLVHLVDAVSGNTALLGTFTPPADGDVHEFEYTMGDYNPVTRRPWLLADLADLNSGDLAVRFTTTGSGTPAMLLVQCDVEVRNIVERRLGMYADGTDAPGWITPTGATFTRAANTTYRVLVRPYTKVVASANYPSDAVTTPLVQYLAGDVTTMPWWTDAATDAYGLHPNGSINTWAGSTGLPAGAVLPFILAESSGTADGQPYDEVVPVVVVDGGTAVEQELTAPASTTYTAMTVVCSGIDGEVPDDDLVVAVRRRSDDSLFGTVTITPADWVAAPYVAGSTTWKRVLGEVVGAVALVSATQYYADFTTTDTVGWQVQALTGPSGSGAKSFNGTTDQATYDGGDVAAADVVVMLHQAADAPTGPSATVTSVAVPELEGGPTCVPTVTVGWTATAMGADFDHYEIQRSDDWTDWADVATLTTEATATWTDYEARLGGLTSSYRIRAVRVDLVPSAWLTLGAVVVDSCGCGLTFTTNHDTAQVLAYPDVYSRRSERAYSWADQVVVRRVYGRDGVVTFRPTEAVLDTFSRRLLIGAITTPAGGIGPRALDALRALAADPDVPYVAVRDESGNRWLATVIITGGSVVRAPDPFHYATVSVVELTRTPTAPVLA